MGKAHQHSDISFAGTAEPKGGGFLIYDPMTSGAEPILLSKHGKVYAYRIMEKA